MEKKYVYLLCENLSLEIFFVGLDVLQEKQNIFRSLFLKSYFVTLKICMSKLIILRFWETVHLPLP